jgi:hypothetical protein
MQDISNKFRFRPRWREGRFEYEELSGDLGAPGTVFTHRSVQAQNVMSAGTGEHAGHRIGIQFGAPGDARNLSLQNANVNTYAPKDLQIIFRGPGGNYLRLEAEWAKMLKAGYRIWVVFNAYAGCDSLRRHHTIHNTLRALIPCQSMLEASAAMSSGNNVYSARSRDPV